MLASQPVAYPPIASESKSSAALPSDSPNKDSAFIQVRSFDEDDNAILTVKDIMKTLDIETLPAVVRMRPDYEIIAEADMAPSEKPTTKGDQPMKGNKHDDKAKANAKDKKTSAKTCVEDDKKVSAEPIVWRP